MTTTHTLKTLKDNSAKDILVLSYVLSPYRGSEASVAWNYVKEMSRDHHLTVLYGCGGEHLGDNFDMERWLADNAMPGVEFVFVKPPWLSRLLNWPNRRGFFSMSFHAAYHLWQREVYAVARRLCAARHFDLIHYLGSSGYSEQGYLWKIGLPYMRGPMGGFNLAPEQMMTHMGVGERLKMRIRNAHIRRDLRHGSRLERILRRTDLLLASTSENARVVREVFGKECDYMPENCMRWPARRDEVRFSDVLTLNIVMAGWLDGRKNNILLLQALAAMRHRERVRVDLVGDGPCRRMLEAYITAHGLDSVVTIHGMLPREQVQDIFGRAHLHVVTSVSEGNPTVVWEAMEHAVPTMTVAHCGMADVVTSDCGILIPVGAESEMTAAIARELDALVENPARLRALSDGTMERAALYQWDTRRRLFNEYYDKAIYNHNS